LFFLKKSGKAAAKSSLDKDDRTFLLRLARETMNAVLRGNRPPMPMNVAKELKYDIPKFMKERRGVFVTLNMDDCLRGCIGHVMGIMPMLDAVIDNAQAAAFKDPRFTPINADELSVVNIEISVLSPLRKVEAINDIEIPAHGVLLEKAGAKAVFLPQVAEEQNWDRDTMLTHLALKAGLGADDWRDGASFQVFTSESFSEQ
jgi:AmmeMemoRadiSam system protein A